MFWSGWLSKLEIAKVRWRVQITTCSTTSRSHPDIQWSEPRRWRETPRTRDSEIRYSSDTGQEQPYGCGKISGFSLSIIYYYYYYYLHCSFWHPSLRQECLTCNDIVTNLVAIKVQTHRFMNDLRPEFSTDLKYCCGKSQIHLLSTHKILLSHHKRIKKKKVT